jgi:UDP-N-acetylmuramate dehydrogenase
MRTVRKTAQIINIPDFCSRNEPMHLHTSFHIGGPADIFCTPAKVKEVEESINLARRNAVPFLVIGGGANILVSDKGIRGMVISMERLGGYSFSEGGGCTALAGVSVSELAEAARDRSLAGIEFLYSLPGSLGGAVFMNARCYGTSVADVLSSVTYLSARLETVRVPPEACSFAYKDSVFQKNGGIILEAELKLRPGDGRRIGEKMEEYRRDRERKGHFTHPSAGSAFKNNRDFGRPTGAIIDSLGLRGFSVGGAQISPKHANIVINTGGASAADVRELIETVKTKVFRAYGFSLEEEVRYVGEWD